MSSPVLAQQERATLCDLLVELGPDAPTLCEGWTTADMAAHLVVRERRPDSGTGLVWAPLSTHAPPPLRRRHEHGRVLHPRRRHPARSAGLGTARHLGRFGRCPLG